MPHEPEPATGTGAPSDDRLRSLDEAATDPIDLFRRWFETARRSGISLPEAVALATASSEAIPSVRMVLLKGADARGFSFFTNYESRKGRELEANPHAALCFHWTDLERQVRVVGSVERVPEAESRAYFDTRPRGSRFGAWASHQSRPLSSRGELEERFRSYVTRFQGEDVPLPPHWGGFRILPDRIEFWEGRTDRLHDRLSFERTPEGWRTEWLYP